MGKIFFNFFKSSKKKFKEKNKQEKKRLYIREKKKKSNYREKRITSQYQLHLNLGFKRKSIISISLIGIISAIIGIVFLFKAQYFAIQTITIESVDNLSNTSISYNSIDSLRKKNIFSVSYDSVLSKLQSYQPNISSIQLKKNLPNGLTINIKSYPISLFILQNNISYALTSNGVAIKQNKNSKKGEIPIIYIIKNRKKSLFTINYSKIMEPASIRNILSLLSSLKDNLIKFPIQKNTFYRTESELHILLKNRTLLIFDINGNIAKQIEKLIVFYKETKNIKYIYIDLRIPNKVFHCDYNSEYQCLKNLKTLYK